MYKILLVEDCKETYQILIQTTAPFAQLYWSKNLEEANQLLLKESYDLIVLDIGLPDGNGIEFCSSLQETHSQVPIFFLTGHSSLPEKVLGFSAGADDYITKPFSILELRARIEARLRKNKFQTIISDFFKWKELQIIKSKQEVYICDHEELQKVELTNLEFKILLYFANRTGEVIARDQILNDIWGENIHIYQRSVDTHVSKLRKKLGIVSHIIESIHGSGYKFNPTCI